MHRGAGPDSSEGSATVAEPVAGRRHIQVADSNLDETPLASPIAAVGHADTAEAPLAGRLASDALPVRDPDRYRVLGELGRGGLGRVLRAVDRETDRPVAIKEMLDPQEASEIRFFREARITARLEHPAIVPVHDAGRWPDGRPFYVMKLVDGRRLDDVIDQTPGKDDRIALLSHVIAVADAIAYAHAKQIVHRDLKPANVLLGSFGETVVIDWGLAKSVAATGDDRDEPIDDPFDSSTTRAGQVIGTPAYMAPEQARGEPSDLRSDVYALGALLHHLLAGEPPYVGESAPLLLDRVRLGARAPVPADVPPALAAIVGRAMARDPEARYAHAGQLADDLRRFVDGRRVEAHRYSTRELVARWLRRRWPVVALAVVALAGAAALGVVWFQSVRRAERLATIARDLGRDVERFEGELRRAYTLPLGDVRGARAHVRAEMAAMAQEVDHLDGAAAAAGRFALGRGHLALGELDDARGELERAWALGLRDPDAALALGLTYARLYDREIDALDQLADEDARARRRAEVERTLRAPAIQYLDGARGESTVPAEYVDAVIDLVEDRFDAADQHARAALGTAPWLYEAYDVIGEGHLQQAWQAILVTDNVAATRQLDLAGDALVRAIDVARSDPDIRAADCRRTGYRQRVAFMRDETAEAETAAAEAACHAALTVDPDNPQPMFYLATAHARVARALIHGGHDPSAALARALDDIDHALAVSPDDEEFLVVRAQILRRRAEWSSSHGGDPTADLRAAMALLERAERATPGDDIPARDLGVALGQLADWERAHGRDAAALDVRALASCGDAIRIAPGTADGYACRAQIHRTLGAIALAGAADPRPDFRAALDDSDAAAARAPADAMQPTERGQAALGLATAAWLDGDDPVAHLARAVDDADLAIKLRPGFDEARALGARAELVWARWLVERGEPFAEHLAHARAYAQATLDRAPADPIARAALAEAAIVAARAPVPRADREAAVAAARALAPVGAAAAELALADAELSGDRTKLAAAADALAGADDSAAALALAGALDALDAKLGGGAAARARAADRFARARARSPRALHPWLPYVAPP